jgi:lipid-binding SYLF domain-containing protein
MRTHTKATGAVREGGSIGFQVGASSTDLIMLVMNERGANKLLERIHAGRGRIGHGRGGGTDGDGAD